ncbi:hypothetical protein JHK87_033380 [Glycine soja]|nr:hypothetical protein JHK87_033380 [Glycine soja]
MDGDIYNEDTNDEDIDDEETNEEFYEATYTYVMEIYALIDILNQFLNMMRGEHIERPLTRRQITSRGYDYIHKALNDDPAIFRQVYRMYPDVFRKLCTIIREKTPLEDTRFICVEEMLASFLQIVGQNTRYCVIRNTFGRSQFATNSTSPCPSKVCVCVYSSESVDLLVTVLTEATVSFPTMHYFQLHSYMHSTEEGDTAAKLEKMLQDGAINSETDR